jgi:hypothetical protein
VVQDLGSCEALVPLLILSPVALEHAERWPSPARRYLLVNLLRGRSGTAVADQVHGHVVRLKTTYNRSRDAATCDTEQARVIMIFTLKR